MRILFPRSLSQNIAVSTPMVTSLTQNWVKKGLNLYLMYHGDRKMKVYSKKKFEVKLSFLKPLSQNFEALAPCGDAINPKMGQKGPNRHFMY